MTTRLVLCGAALTLTLALALVGSAAAAPPSYDTSTYSSPIAMSAGGRLVWVVNPDLDTVSVIRTSDATLIKTIAVGDEPQGVALDPANRYAYVANAADNTVSVIRIKNASPKRFKARLDKRVGRGGALTTGAEPWNIVSSPDGRRMFVANSSQDTITVIDSSKRKVRGHVRPPRILGSVDVRDSRCNDPDRRRHFQPRGLAVTADSKRLYVTAFLSFTRPGYKQSDDDGKAGVVCRLNINTRATKMRGYRPAVRLTLGPQLTGFNIDSDPDTLEPDPVGAFPNQLQSIVVRGDHAYVPSVAASPQGPRRRNGNGQAYVNEIDNVKGDSETDGGSINLLIAGLAALGEDTLFYSNPWAIAFTTQHSNGAAYVVSAGSDVLVKLWVNTRGELVFTVDENTSAYVDLNNPLDPATSGRNAGKNPQGIVINRKGTRAYVNNYVSRNVSVVDLTTDKVIKVINTGPLPKPGTRDEIVQLGKELFYSARGIFNRPANATDLTQIYERLASQGFGSCSSCHFKGLTDGVVWEGHDGPRKTPALNATFNPRDRSEQRMLNYSATYDELEDFDIFIRGREGHGPGDLSTPTGTTIFKTCDSPPPETNSLDPDHGLIMSDLGNPDRSPCVLAPLTPSNANRPQFTVTMPGGTRQIPGLVALKEYVRYGIRTPNAPLPSSKVRGGLDRAKVRAGRRLFMQSGCASCHVGGKWTAATKNFKSPPNPSTIFTETSPAAKFGDPVSEPYVASFLRDIGSFNIGVRGKGNPLGHQIGAEELAGAQLEGPVAEERQDALGRDYNGDGKGNGYNVPSLLGINALPPYYHNGACESLTCVLHDVKHRTGNGKVRDRLKKSGNRARLLAFLQSIDGHTKPVSGR